MTILNLNGPTGRAPRGKKTVRAWMGIGLVIAVLGIGSTFAANISISNNDQSEFGQGVTKTVYCGANNSPHDITVTPISAFVNSSGDEGADAVPSRWVAPTWSTQTFVRVGSSSSQYVARTTFVNEISGASETNVAGYWVTSRVASSPTWSTTGTTSSTYSVFAPQIKSGSDYGFYKYTNWQDGSWTVAVAARKAFHNDSKFELKGITISGINSECAGKDFVISAYSGDNEPESLPLVHNYNEIAVLYGNTTSDPTFNFDRTGIASDGAQGTYATVTQKVGQISIMFKDDGRANADDLVNIVVESQDDLIG